jgi:hypothetical protein
VVGKGVIEGVNVNVGWGVNDGVNVIVGRFVFVGVGVNEDVNVGRNVLVTGTKAVAVNVGVYV